MSHAPARRSLAVGWVALGGASGTAVRYLAVEHFPAPSGWPWVILGVNLAGSFLLGWLVEAMTGHARLRLLAGAGFCGGLTTYSTFAVEVAGFARDGHLGSAAGYLVASVLGGLLAAAAGLALGRRSRFAGRTA